jgi:hypothetical protein
VENKSNTQALRLFVPLFSYWATPLAGEMLLSGVLRRWDSLATRLKTAPPP